MAKRDNHYDVAFEAYLRDRQISYVAVDESRRSPGGSDATSGQTLKSLDFIVSPRETQVSWLVDVKGRHFPAGPPRRYYRLTPAGQRRFRQLHQRWQTLAQSLTGLLNGSLP